MVHLFDSRYAGRDLAKDAPGIARDIGAALKARTAAAQANRGWRNGGLTDWSYACGFRAKAAFRLLCLRFGPAGVLEGGGVWMDGGVWVEYL